MKEFTCIICPRGCLLKVDDNMNVTGNTCPRGKDYAISELTNPVRTIVPFRRIPVPGISLASAIFSLPYHY